MNRLTYADRELLLRTFDRLQAEWKGSDEILLTDVGAWAKELIPSFGFELTLIRNITSLSRYLVNHRQEHDLADIARGGLLYVLQAGQHGPSKLGDFGLLDDAFIASYAVHEIRARLGEQAAYSPPRLTREEQEHAETQFLDYYDAPLLTDEELIVQARKTVDGLASLATCGLFRRLQQNISFLVAVLDTPDRTQEQQDYARAALSYFVCEEDAIDDRLGIVGYLDDNFIAQMAVDLIEPHREPWLELLDATVGVWPFLNSLVIDDGSGGRPISEYMIVNSALSCAELRTQENRSATVLVVPFTGPAPFLIGFLATLGLVQQSGQREVTEDSFRAGQKVLVDNCAIAEFAGFEWIAERRMFGLKQYQIQLGERLQRVRYWPISDLRRLVPAASTRATRGQLKFNLNHSDVLLPGLEYLFNATKTAQLSAVDKRVIIVMPTTLAAEFCKSTQLYGQPIKDVIPVGQVLADGDSEECWSTRFGVQKPILLFASDLDVARTYAEEHREKIEIVIVDIAGRNRGKHASLKRLNRLQIPCLLIATERVANETEVDKHNDLSVWEWVPEDLTALVWPETRLTLTSGEIARFEHRVRSSSSIRPIVEPISLPIVSETHRVFLALRRLARQRGADTLTELEEIIAQAFFATTQLMRCASPLSVESTCIVDATRRIKKIRSLARSSNFLSNDEQAAIAELVNRTQEFAEQLQDHNPKAKALDLLVSEYPAATILCPDARLIAELEAVFVGKRNRVFASVAGDIEFTDGLIIPGWFRQNRMAAVLSPPIADPLVLVLYGPERQWHQQFSMKRRRKREERMRLKGRAAIFPSLRGWKAPKPPPEVPAEMAAVSDDIEQVRTEIDDSFRQRVYAQVQSGKSDADVRARLVLFTGGVYGLFTDSYKLNVVTHLLDGYVEDDDEKASVKLVKARDVGVGDAVVFSPKSRDLIREVADELLHPGQRDMSNEWQRSLRKYVEKRGLSAEEVCDQLHKAGCKSGSQAIHNWIYDADMIAPQQYRSDVPAIAQVTGDTNLANKIDLVLDAIKQVRSTHQQKAPRVIAKRIRQKAATVVRQEQADHSIVHLEGNLVLVRVAEPASDLIPIKYASANRLIEGDSWHE